MGVFSDTPVQRSENRYVHQQIQHGDEADRQNDGPRNVLSRLLDLTSNKADVVIPAVVVHGDERCRSEARPETAGHPESTRREVERHSRMKVERSTDNDPATGRNDYAGDDDSRRTNRTNIPIQ